MNEFGVKKIILRNCHLSNVQMQVRILRLQKENLITTSLKGEEFPFYDRGVVTSCPWRFLLHFPGVAIPQRKVKTQRRTSGIPLFAFRNVNIIPNMGTNQFVADERTVKGVNRLLPCTRRAWRCATTLTNGQGSRTRLEELVDICTCGRVGAFEGRFLVCLRRDIRK